MKKAILQNSRDIKELKSDVAVLKKDVAVLKGDVTNLKCGQSRLESKFDYVISNHEKRITAIELARQ
jgi:hypothetical protein